MNPVKKIRRAVNKTISDLDPLYTALQYSRKKLKKYQKSVGVKPLSEENKRKIKEMWGKYSGWFEFYNTVGDSEKAYYYFPDTWFYKYVDSKLNNWPICDAIDDKCLYDYFFYDICRPKTIVKICNGMYLDAQSRIITLTDAVAACRAAGRVIVKPSCDSSAGNGILFWKEGSNIDIESVLRDSKNEVVQQVIEQHPALAQIHSGSINTIRIVTMTTEQGVKEVSSLLRIGVGKSQVDNFAQGGIAVGIDKEGKLKGKAYTARGKCFDRHPDGPELLGVSVPGFHECLDICKATAPRFARYSRLTSWDFAIDPDCKPIFIEANLCHGGIDLHQMCNGPIFGDEETTRRMIKKYIK